MIRQKIRKWLDIKEPIIKDWTASFERFEKEHWKFKQCLKDRVKVDCPVCKKILILWPMETEAYYTRDGKAYHVECYDKLTKPIKSTK